MPRSSAARAKKSPTTNPNVTPAAVVERRRERQIVEGRVVALLDDGRAVVVTSGAREVRCRCAHAIDRSWLRAALALAPVPAEITVGDDDDAGSLWAVFPTEMHEGAVAERLALAAADEVKISCGQSTLTLTKEGKVSVRGRDVTARGSRVTRIQGGTVRVN